MQDFPLSVGQTRRIEANPVDSVGVAQGITGNVSYTSSHPEIATVTPNAGVGGQTQVDVHAVANGQAIITAQAMDAELTPQSFSAQFSVTVASHASTFHFVDLGLL